ncbi:acyl transferase [Spirosoma endophyticum]|uniref:Acyl-protein synthetase, LuxE n=1 Tax=Spirosoma endophyticum TaxID=662367 RepID=A0A1I1RH10_9BACT|nr:acyl transferase [Spirosoma endophyticum]SFD33442.1 hypothetical protein SAMN05216167_104398 [Spirosoma endophyticum]
MSFSLTLSTGAAALRQSLRQQILALSSSPPNRDTFESLALTVFQYQAAFNPVYSNYLRHLNCQPEQVTTLRQVPFMPIGFFKQHAILTGIDVESNPVSTSTLTFASSGTTGEQTSRHYVPDADLYDAISTRIFEQTYGPLQNFHILALLPSYLERNNSSLVYMVQRFIEQTGLNQATKSAENAFTSGFFLHNYDELTERLQQLARQPDGKKILLIGVTFGLLDWAESTRELTFLGKLPDLIVMETGGMKGRRKELLREEVHEILTNHLGIRSVHSEYGMTELLSQAYSMGSGVFRPSSTLRVFLRDINDPFFLYPEEYSRDGERRTGGINIVDLANLDSCSFIETQDLGQYIGDADESIESGPGNFRVIGRFDNSDVRGCNLMIG